MKQFKPSTLLLVSFSLLSPALYAGAVMKDKVPVTHSALYDWTGFYAGINAGLTKHTMTITDNRATTFNATVNQVSNPDLAGGFQLGYRKQVDLSNVSGVFGVELSTHFSNVTYSQQYGSPFALYQLNSENQLKNVTLLEAIGGIAADRTLLFLAAGLSYSNISGNTTSINTIPFYNSFNMGKNAIGTALGGGIEYAFTDVISGRFKIDVITPNVYSTANNTGDTYQITNSIVQGTLGVNFNLDKAHWLGLRS